ncbi:MAG: isomerase [uncultured Pseudonocardia sp.]|uniref:2-hydroxychromene-2-carboxylate isomerase n=1 Tax=uncultured Pseudonocardia sp. TaxID=211455 RepID=A0A6J4Q5F9_9PSEU|nr:MAG: isomerase [uncultured Pseudonocardia sp.]
MSRGNPRVHFSFRSPFSWIALTRLGRLVPGFEDRVEMLPYYDPDERTAADLAARGAEFHYQPMSKAKHLYILFDVRRQAQREGLTMSWPVDRDPWWELPHLAWLRAVELGRGPQFRAALTAARWERGEDVCLPETVRAAAGHVGLPADELAAAAHDPRLREGGTDALVRAYEDDVFGVPYFRIGRHRFWGLDRVDDFAAELTGRRVGEERESPNGQHEPPAAVREAVGAYDNDTAGGCG